MSKIYTFISFGSTVTGKNLGCCIIECSGDEAAQKARDLGLEPNEPIHAQAFELNEEQFKEEGMELNKLYSREEMLQRGNEKDTVKVAKHGN